MVGSITQLMKWLAAILALGCREGLFDRRVCTPQDTHAGYPGHLDGPEHLAERGGVQCGREALAGDQEPPGFACKRPEFLGPKRPLCSWLPQPPLHPSSPRPVRGALVGTGPRFLVWPWASYITSEPLVPSQLAHKL